MDLYYKGFGGTDIAKEFNIYNKKLVNEWVRKYKKEGFSSLEAPWLGTWRKQRQTA
ncbi:terminase gpP N-terminus-related DNA-binding protein [Alteribacillus bidgolensis]|uniref:terminase gpP N-terminus-related DNA-binding protein n=1 Tax=Alteribacillus bidgolensis TaxID=930129 RepID=UPI000B87EE42